MELIILILGGLYLFFKIRSEPPRRDYGKLYAEKFKARQRDIEEAAARKECAKSEQENGKTK